MYFLWHLLRVQISAVDSSATIVQSNTSSSILLQCLFFATFLTVAWLTNAKKTVTRQSSHHCWKYGCQDLIYDMRLSRLNVWLASFCTSVFPFCNKCETVTLKHILTYKDYVHRRKHGDSERKPISSAKNMRIMR